MKPKKVFSLLYLLEPLDSNPSFATRPMFGGLIVWYEDRQVLCLVESPGENSWKKMTFKFDIWNGLLVPTDRVHHASLCNALPALIPHPVLGKWLYVPLTDERFEETADAIIKLIKDKSNLIGIPIGVKKTKKKIKKKTKRKA